MIKLLMWQLLLVYQVVTMKQNPKSLDTFKRNLFYSVAIDSLHRDLKQTSCCLFSSRRIFFILSLLRTGFFSLLFFFLASLERYHCNAASLSRLSDREHLSKWNAQTFCSDDFDFKFERNWSSNSPLSWRYKVEVAETFFPSNKNWDIGSSVVNSNWVPIENLEPQGSSFVPNEMAITCLI